MNPYRIGTFYRDDFTAACNSIAEAVGVANPSRRTGGGQYRVSGITGRRGRMNRGRGHGYGRGRGRGRGRGPVNCENKCFCNGVNISDLTHSYTDKEYEQLTGYICGQIYEARKEKHNNKRTRTNKNNDDEYKRSKQIAEVTTNKEKEQTEEPEKQQIDKQINEKGNQNGKKVWTICIPPKTLATVYLTYKRVYITHLILIPTYKTIIMLSLFKIFNPGADHKYIKTFKITRTETSSSVGSVKNSQNFRGQAQTEMDSHANMCCVGRNFTPIAYTGETCSVSP